jgi:cell division septation protein DedD
VAEGETQYQIPVSSKQLIVYFVFLVIALSAAFLAGVMVGRNVDSSPEPVARDIQEAAAAEEPAASPTPDALTYGSTLQGDKVEGLAPRAAGATQAPATRPTPTPAPAPSPSPARATEPARSPSPAAAKAQERATPRPTPKPVATPRPAVATKATPKATPTPAKPQKSPAATPLARLTIQVGAFKERAAAEAIVKRLKGKGYSAYLVPVSEGLFNVRVGSFTDREDAERVLAKLESQEKFKPFIVKP